MANLSALHQRDGDLQGAFEEGGKDIEKKRDARNNRVKKIDFFRQLITICICDKSGKVIPGCEFKVTRDKLTEANIYGQIKKCPLKDVEIDYFLESSGTPFWMEDMMLKTQPSPMYYMIVPKVRRPNIDVFDDPCYEGQTAVIFTNVPNKAKDEKTIVDTETLRAYIMCAIIEVDPYSKPFFQAIEETQNAIKAIDKKIKGVAKIDFREANGEKMSDEKAQVEREELYNSFAAERMQADKRLKAKERGLAKQLEWRNTMGIEFQMIAHDENTDTNTWAVKLFGTTDAEEIEDLLIAKDDWAGIKCACWCEDPKLPPWAGRGRLPDGTKNDLEPDYSLLQANMAGVRIARAPNGVGSLKLMDRSSVPFAADHFEYYYGNFEMGKKHGRGMEINDVGIYSGRWIEGWKNGAGRWDYKDGTTVVGNFGVNLLTNYPANLTFVNPYLEGDPQGEVEILFSDGGFYRGQVKDGRINGQGSYQSGFGELSIGTFVNGMLHGENGYFKNHAGEQFQGTWKLGEMHGIGRYESERGDTYNGYFDHSLKHGRGVAHYKNRGNFRGYFMNGLRYGKAEADFGRRTKKEKRLMKEKAEQALKSALEARRAREEEEKKTGQKKMELSKEDEKLEEEKLSAEAKMFEFKFVYQGYFFGDQVTSGGIMTKVDNQTSAVISRRDGRKILPISTLIAKDRVTNKEIRRKLEKYNDMEHHVRSEIHLKKSRIFNQQKHFMKRSMYLEEKSAISKADVEIRAVTRRERLDRVDLEKVTSKHALVPRINNISNNLTEENYLRKVFFAIKPDADHGDLKKVRRTLARIATSDFEEIQERQRFLKYDLIFARAEQAFIEKKKAGR